MPTTLGVIADTHIPDRARSLPLEALDVFEKWRVAGILHAGDLSVPRVLRQLGEIAPATSVRGNTDILLTGKLPWVQQLTVESVEVGMAHGHGGWLRYIPDRIDFLLHGPKRFSYYEQNAARLLPNAQVVVCGHTHVPANYWHDGQLIFNPGSATRPNSVVRGLPPSVGLLHINGGNVRGEIVFI